MKIKLFARIFLHFLVASGFSFLTFLLYFHVLIPGTYVGQQAAEVNDIAQKISVQFFQKQEDSPAFVFLDMGQELIADLGYPALIPRAVLARIAQTALKANPKALYLDVDLGWRSTDEDMQLFLDLLVEHADTKSKILLLHNARTGPEDSQAVFLRTAYDEVVEAADNIHWVIGETAADSDGIVRSAPLFRQACRAGHPVIRPSAALQMHLIDGISKADKALWDSFTKTDHTCPINFEVTDTQICEQDTQPDSDQVVPDCSDSWLARFGHRYPVNYSVEWDNDGDRIVRNTQLNGRSAPLLSVIPAQLILNAEGPVSPDVFNDRIVIIGSSSADVSDLHAIPIGSAVPGSIVIANQIASLATRGLHPPSAYLFSMITFFLIFYATTVARHVPVPELPFFRGFGSEMMSLLFLLVWPLFVWSVFSASLAIGASVIGYLVLALDKLLDILDGILDRKE